MNSDYWQDLWRRQPSPAAPRDYEQLIRDVQRDAEEIDREWRSSDRLNIWFPLVLAALNLADLFGPTIDELIWCDVMLSAVLVAWAMAHLIFSIRRRAIEDSFEQSILGRMGRLHRLLRMRLRYYDAMLVLGPLVMAALIAAIGTLGRTEVAADFNLKSRIPLVAITGVACSALGWWIASDRRKNQARLRQRLAELDDVRTRLVNGDSESKAD